MPGVRTGFAHVVAPLTEGKVTEFLLENGAHPFHFCPSPPVSLLFLSLTRPEKTEVLGQKFPFGELKCHNGRWKCPSWTFFGGRILSRRDAPWGTSRIPHDVSCSERTNAYVEAIRIQKRPASWKFPKEDSIGTGRNGYACFSTLTFSVCGSVARGSAYELHLVPVHHIHALGECHADTALAVVDQASRHVDDADLGIG